MQALHQQLRTLFLLSVFLALFRCFLFAVFLVWHNRTFLVQGLIYEKSGCRAVKHVHPLGKTKPQLSGKSTQKTLTAVTLQG